MSWISKNMFLSDDDMKVNARLVYKRLKKHGFSVNAIAGILGNMEAESTINPGIWEGLQPYIGGYGLVQWTPYEKYADWAGEGWQNNGDMECDRIAYEFDEGIQYYPTSDYPISAAEYKTSLESPETLAAAWMYNYERPWSYDNCWYRQERARWWYDWLLSSDKDEPSEPAAPKEVKHISWLLTHRA